MRPIPVLMYHHVNPHKGDMITITPDVFEGQMKYLHDSGYRTLRIDELLSRATSNPASKEKAVLITFDDGWLDNYIYAFPIIKKYRINLTIFIVTDWVESSSENNPVSSPPDITPPSPPLNLRGGWVGLSGEKSGVIVPSHAESKALIEKGEAHKVMLNWELIEEMTESGLVSFYSHTKSHARCDRLPELEILKELIQSKEVIERKTGRPCSYLCWPKGKYSKIAIDIAKNTGYKAIFTTDHGVVKTGFDPFAIKRIEVKDSVAWFRKRMIIYSNSILSACYLRIKKK